MFQRLMKTVFAIAISAAAASAQQTSATLTGTITDPAGAVVANVTITATNLATNAVRETRTDDTGRYTLPFLPAGDYSVTAVANGFQTQKIDRITLQVQQTARIDMQLRIGNVTETVNVEAYAVVLQTDNATVGAAHRRAPGGQVNMLTRRGGNRLTGTLWEFNRNDALTQAYDAIADKSVAPPRLNRNQFGANLGGPVYIPKLYHGKDKTFFFFNWESGR